MLPRFYIYELPNCITNVGFTCMDYSDDVRACKRSTTQIPKSVSYCVQGAEKREPAVEKTFCLMCGSRGHCRSQECRISVRTLSDLCEVTDLGFIATNALCSFKHCRFLVRKIGNRIYHRFVALISNLPETHIRALRIYVLLMWKRGSRRST